MVFLIWIEGTEFSKASMLPRIDKIHLVCLDDKLNEIETFLIEGHASESSCDEEILDDWRKAFEVIQELPDDNEKRILIFPRARQRCKFIYIYTVLRKKGDLYGRYFTHKGTLGELLVTNGEKLEAEIGIPRLIETMKEYGIETLISEGYISEHRDVWSSREGILRNKGYQYFGNLSTKRYHLRTCDQLNKIADKNFVGLGKNPGGKGWSPCPVCINDLGIASTSTLKSGTESIDETKKNRVSQSKSDIMKYEISALCKEYRMHAEFVGGTAFVTTVAGEWFFIYNDRPIKLHHKNYSDRAMNAPRTMKLYHMQDKKFASPLHVIRYISEHDLNLKNRLMHEIDGELAAERYYYDDAELGIKDAEGDEVIRYRAIAHLHSNASLEERIIVLSDILSELRRFLRKYQNYRIGISKECDANEKNNLERYYKALRDALGKLQVTYAWKEFNVLIYEVFSENSGESRAFNTVTLKNQISSRIQKTVCNIKRIILRS